MSVSAPARPKTTGPETFPQPSERPNRSLHRGPRVKAVAITMTAVVMLTLAGIGLGTRGATPTAPVPSVDTAPRITARGQVRPISQARVGSIEGGIVRQLLVEPGDLVEEQQEIARLRGPLTTEILVAPQRGTVTDILVRIGDTLAPGTTVATLGDLSRLQIETTDVDEFIVGRLVRGQRVTMTVEALDRRELQGMIRSVALVPRTTSAGDDHYPVVIDLSTWPPELRPGMTVRLSFSD